MQSTRRTIIGCLLATLATALLTTTAAAQDAVRLVKTPNGGIQPQAAVDDDGVIHLIYYTGDPGAGDIHYVRSTDDGSTFSDPIRVNTDDGRAIAMGNIRGAHLALGRGGRPHVAWMGHAKRFSPAMNADELPMLYTRLSDDGTRFEPPRNVMTRSGVLDGGGSIAADRAGHVYVTWQGRPAGAPEGETHRALFVARSDDDGATFTPETAVDPDPAGACGCCGMRAAAGPAGLLVLYRSAGDGFDRDMRLVWADPDQPRFSGITIDRWHIGACPMSSASIAMQGDQIALGFESENTVRLALTDRTRPGDARVVATVSESNLSKHPTVAVSQSGNILIAWTEGMAWNRPGTLRYRLFDAQGNETVRSPITAAVEIDTWSLPSAVATSDGGFVVFH